MCDVWCVYDVCVTCMLLYVYACAHGIHCVYDE